MYLKIYTIEDYISSETYRKELEDMPLDIVLGSLVFFYSLNELLKATKDYFSQETIEMQHLEEVLVKNGTGIKAFILGTLFKFSETTSLDILRI
jgi:hypothetical protein